MVDEKSANLCPVCGYEMEVPPRDYNICLSCGTEFGVNDVNSTIPELRESWISAGPRWWSTVIPKPPDWNPFRQLSNLGIGLAGAVVQRSRVVLVSSGSTSTVKELPVPQVSVGTTTSGSALPYGISPEVEVS